MSGKHRIKTRSIAALCLGLGFVGIVGLSVPASSIAQTPPTTTTQTTPLVNFTPGLWEVKQRMSGGPRGGQEQNRTTCMTAEMLASSALGPMRPTPPGQQSGSNGRRAPSGARTNSGGREAPSCQLSNLRNQAGAVSYQSACATPLASMNSNWQGTAEAERFQVSGEGSIMGRTIRTQVSGRRTGDCPPA
jgi:hypothetical protein